MNPIPYASLYVGQPLIILLQLAAFPLLVWLFFGVNYRPAPVPQLFLAYPFVVLANVLARAFRPDWLYLTDIVFWTFTLAAIVINSVYAHHQRKQQADLLVRLDGLRIDPARLGLTAAERSPAERSPTRPDSFARWQSKAVLISVIISAATVSGVFLKTYGEMQMEKVVHQTALIEESNAIEKERLAQARADSIAMQHVATGLASLSATTNRLLYNQVRNQTNLQKVARQITPLTRIEDSIRRDLRELKQRIHDAQKEDTDYEPRPNWWQRLRKKLNVRRVDVQRTNPDSLYREPPGPADDFDRHARLFSPSDTIAQHYPH